jgi:lipid A 4'-phosphatase
MSRLKARHEEALAFGILLVLASVVFTVWPEIDLAAARLFYVDGRFAGTTWAWSKFLYRWFPWFGAALLVGCGIVLLRARGTRRPPKGQVRRAGMVLMVAVFGVWLAVHAGLKDNWGRPRPGQVQAFNGPSVFQPALHASSECRTNCSFVSGHAAGAFALLALGGFGTRRTRWRWWFAGLGLGTAVGLARMAQGGHFFSDIVFSLVVIWGVTILVREVWLRVALRRRRARQDVIAGLTRNP